MEELINKLNKKEVEYDLEYDFGFVISSSRNGLVDIQLMQRNFSYKECIILGNYNPVVNDKGIVLFVSKSKYPCFLPLFFVNNSSSNIYNSNDVIISSKGEYKVDYGNSNGNIFDLPSYDTKSQFPNLSRADRNNNPGNIKVSSYTKTFIGVIGVESIPASDGGHFLIFDSPENGIKAIARLLKEGKSYKNVTGEQAIKKYNGNGSYGATDVGLIPNQDFQSQIQDEKKLLDVANKIAKQEGFKGNKATLKQGQVKISGDGTISLEN